MFNYQTLSVDLHRQSRSMVITLSPEASYLEKIFELEGLLTWCLDKVEITTVLIQAVTGGHQLAPNSEELARLEPEKLEKLAARYQKMAELLLLIPATTLIDINLGGGGLGHDWALAADIIIAHQEATWSFTGSRSGLPLFAGALLALSSHGLEGRARGQLARCKQHDLKELARLGLPVEFYDQLGRDYKISDLIRALYLQSPLVRLQQKKAMLSMLYPQLEKAKKIENEVLTQALISGDWKTSALNLKAQNSVRSEFKSALELKAILRSSQDGPDINQ